MTNTSRAAQLFQEPETSVKPGEVTSVSGHAVEVQISGMTFSARTAFSCLVGPLPGDRVVCAQDEYGEYFILGIPARFSLINPLSTAAFLSIGT